MTVRSVLVGTFAVFALCAPAKASALGTKRFDFKAEAPGTTVIARHLKDGVWVETKRCEAPCKMRLDTAGLGLFRFENAKTGTSYAPWPMNRDKKILAVNVDDPALSDPKWGEYWNRYVAALEGEDRDAVPFRRLPPAMPPKAVRSGWCVARFDLSDLGEVDAITELNCSEEMFARTMRDAVQTWTYLPRIKAGEAVSRPSMTAIAEFGLFDAKNRWLPPKTPQLGYKDGRPPDIMTTGRRMRVR